MKQNILPIVLSPVVCIALAAQQTQRVSVSPTGVQASDGDSAGPAVSGDGRHVAFGSLAANLVSGDTNGVNDVFVHDRLSGSTRRVSISSAGAHGNQSSQSPSISFDGRHVAFESAASNLVANDNNGRSDVFVHDLVLATTVRVSLSAVGAEANDHSSVPSISGDGRYVVFQSGAKLVSWDNNGRSDVYLRDLVAGTTTRVSIGMGFGGVDTNDSSFNPRISLDGAYICFASYASNIAVGDVNGVSDVFLYNRLLGTTTAVTVDPFHLIGNGNSHTPDVSNGGAFVAFTSSATNLVPGDSNGQVDVFVWDRLENEFSLVSASSSGVQGDSQSFGAMLAADGSAVVFTSSSTNLVAGDSNARQDVFIHTLGTGQTVRVSVSSSGSQGNNHSNVSGVSADGTYVSFQSLASNLVPNDSNGTWDVFLHGPPCSLETIYCTAKVNSNGCAPITCSSGRPTLTGPDDFAVQGYRVLNLKSGLFFWGLGAASVPFGGGTRCVVYPVVRTPLQNSGGSTTANDCTGSFNFLFTQALMGSFGLSAGTHVFGQWWYRDPFFPLPNNVGLSDAVEFVIQ